MKKITRAVAGLLAGLIAVPVVILGTVDVWAKQEVTGVQDSADTSTDSNNKAKSDNGGSIIDTGDFKITVNCGLEGNYRYYAAIPVTIQMESVSSDFEGVLRIIAPGDEYGDSDPVAYEKEIMLTQGNAKTITMSVSEIHSSTLYLELENTKGKTILTRRISTNCKISENALVGILSDDFTALNYFDAQNVDTNNYSGSTELVELSADNIPEQASGLEALSYLIINSYDTSRLSADQGEAIRTWVSNGGILIVGTGSDYQQTFAALQDVCSDVSVSGFVEGTLDIEGYASSSYLTDEVVDQEDAQDEEDAENEEDEEQIDTEPEEGSVTEEQVDTSITFGKQDGLLDISMNSGKNLDGVFEDDRWIWLGTYGQGNVVVTAFNLGMEPVNSWSQKDEMAQRILNEAACGYSKQRLADLNYGSSTDYWSVADSVNSIFESKTPKVWLIVICLISFAALCPISYPILKGMDKREYIWYVIPGLAVFFCIIIFATSTNLRIRHPQEASLTLLYDKTELGSGISQEVSVGILVPSAKKESVDFTNTLSNIRTVNYNYYYSYSNGDQETTDYTKMIRETAEGYQVAIQNNETFDTSYFTFNANNDLEGMEGIETSWVRTTYGMSGTVTNHTGYDLSAVIVFCDSKCVEIGDLADGETAAFTESDVQAYYSFYMLSDFFQSSKQYHKASQIKSIYERVYDSIVASGSSQSSNAVSQAYVVGYIDDWDVNYVGDSKVREFNAAVYVKGAPIPYEGYEDAVSFSVNDYAYDNYDWDSSDGQMYELEVELPVYFDYRLNEVYALVRTESTYGTSEITKVYAWNWDTNQYDELFVQDDIMEFEGECPYVFAGQGMTIKFETTSSWEGYAPKVEVIGGVD